MLLDNAKTPSIIREGSNFIGNAPKVNLEYNPSEEENQDYQLTIKNFHEK